MRNADHHILFLATEYDAPGMRPYARTVINTMWQAGDHVLIVSRYGIDSDAFPGIPADDITWIDYPTSKLSKAVFRFRPASVLRAINDIIERCGIRLVFSLTEEIILADSIRSLQRQVTLLYTVHDASFHDYQFISPVRWLKNRLLIARPQRLMLARTQHQVTNSATQREDILQQYPYHRVHYAPFPTLITDAIANGDMQVEELRDTDRDYILFFGTMHLYKGVHLLYEAYRAHPELHDRQLVIAGSGNIPFVRHDDESGVIFINRYIDDRELRDLFQRAAVVVYPYISATQSGVTSIASYFGQPMVLSDLPFFKETCGSCDDVTFFASGDSDALADAIEQALQAHTDTATLYQRQYSQQALRSALDQAINATIQS